MEETYFTKAIILERKPFREFDSKVTVYSYDYGKLEFIARGTKKIKSKLAGHLEPVILSNLMIIRGRQYDYIGGAASQSCYISIKNDLTKLIAAGKIINIFNQVIKPKEKDRDVFKLLDSVLALLNYEKNVIADYDLLFNFFILKLMVQLGHKPELYDCTICKKEILPDNNKFDLTCGGLICQNCQNNSKDKLALLITSSCIKTLRFVVKNDLSKLTKLKISDKLTRETAYLISAFYHFYYS